MDLFLDSINLKSIEGHDFVSIVNCSEHGHGRTIGHELGCTRILGRAHTVKPAYYGLFMVPLFHYELYVRVFFRNRLEVLEKESARVGRAGPFVAVLENDFPTLGDKNRMSIGLDRAKARPENWSGRRPCSHRRRGTVLE